jgi:ribosomal protein L32
MSKRSKTRDDNRRGGPSDHVGKPQAQLPACPSCDERKLLVQIEAGIVCETCGVIFDPQTGVIQEDPDDDDEGEDAGPSSGKT